MSESTRSCQVAALTRPNDGGYTQISDPVGRLSVRLAKREARAAMDLDADSVYGSAVAMPQVARSTQYNKFFSMLAIRALFNLFVNLGLQFVLLVYIGEATQIMAPLGGQMHLCDFGAGLATCPDAEHCTGPGGTRYTSTRLYGYTQWTVQKFAKQALIDVFPEKQDDIESKVDPGEYGIESFKCRLLCIFLFITSVMPELYGCYHLFMMIWSLPNTPEKSQWLRFKASGEEEFCIAGMPRQWKVFNFFVVLTPKAVLCHYVLWEGTLLLMDTAGIMDMILGAMSMTFVLSIDEIIFSVITSNTTHYIMKEFSEFQEEADDNAEADPRGLETGIESPRTNGGGMQDTSWALILWHLIPRKLMLILFIMFCYMFKYYEEKCQWMDGQFVSKDMYLPLTAEYHFSDFLLDEFLHTIPRSMSPFWTMPDRPVLETTD
eukprot:gnl/MRDRNA2_/MRDRNA2_107679_c0_seq1.p1 gnl/MRDRNA2_/MRDRNA2_107679_c0~~gnl/MRDRNA2_/MRDRNA2_107679_c0_seq1.p1  ORF type:complete len:434 (+),score=68.72 gnl/MRDRNA2_/MRDRNA2_107679_c0_seq1:62-1363(+)